MFCRKTQHLSCAFLLLLSLLPSATLSRPFVLVLSQDDLSDPAAATNQPDDVPDFDDFPDSEAKPDWVLDPGSWSPLFEPDPNSKIPSPNDADEVTYYNGVSKMVEAASRGEFKVMEDALSEIETASALGHPHGQSMMGFLYSMGIGRERSDAKAFLHHNFAAQGGNMHSKMALAYTYYRQEATALYKLVAERGPWSSLSRWALESYLKGDIGKAFLLYSRMAEIGYEVAQSNAAWILDKYGERSTCMGESGHCTDAERHQRAHVLWWRASEQGNEHAALLIGDAYYYGRGTERDFDRAAEAYMHAKSQSNAQAMFNLGYMHEHGLGLPLDLHLAKRYYDEALEVDPAAKLPVSLALVSLWIRRNYADSFLVGMIDSLPEVYPKVEVWVETVIMEEGNATILTLFVCLLTVLYLRERQRRNAAVGAVPPHQQQQQPGEQAAPLLN